eukprot:scpid107799/ scgid31686/ 
MDCQGHSSRLLNRRQPDSIPFRRSHLGVSATPLDSDRPLTVWSEGCLYSGACLAEWEIFILELYMYRHHSTHHREAVNYLMVDGMQSCQQLKLDANKCGTATSAHVSGSCLNRSMLWRIAHSSC